MSKRIYEGDKKQRAAASALKFYQERKNKGLCLSCGKDRDLPSKRYCARCRDKITARYENNIRQGLCGTCGLGLLHTTTRCAVCLNAQLESRRRLKRETISAYGGKCSCCGITEIEFLTLEHSKGDGAAHKKQLGRFGNTFYRYLKECGFPQDLGLEVHCMNCNFSKGKYGYCPHKNSLTQYPVLWENNQVRLSGNLAVLDKTN